MFPMPLKITRTSEHTPHVSSFFMEPAKGARPGFVAGQVAVLRAGGGKGKGTYIAFAAAPEDEGYEFLVKRGQALGALFEAGPGAPVMLEAVVGRGFPVEEYRGHDLVFVAMGTGLAPLRSALRHVFQTRDDYGRLIVLYGARTLDDFCFEEEIDTLWRSRGVELRQVISRPDGREWSGPTGYVQGLLDHLVPELERPVALVCGSAEMIAQTRGRLLELGFEPGKILTNY